MFSKISKKFVFVSVLMFFLFPVFVLADSEGQTKTFFIESSFDLEQREQIKAVLEKGEARN